MNVIHIGNKFYFESGTMMGANYIHDENGYTRTDWGKIGLALEAGEEVHIRPANAHEMAFFRMKLEQFKNDREKEKVNGA